MRAISIRRVRAIFTKELREYRRNRQIVVSMAVLPVLFCVYPVVQVISLTRSAAAGLAGKEPLVYLLAIPALVPAALAAYSVAGERQQATLEPVLTTPVRREEFLLGKAAAALVPALAVSYAVFAVFVTCIRLFAQPQVAAVVLHGSGGLALVVFTPLLAAWSIWVGIGFSARSADPRVATQFSVLASFPSIIVTTVVATGAVHGTPGLALGLGALLLLLDGFGWRVVSATFDRERLVTGTR
jgi:ABC-type transport system involved in multi-copper enzyme maturation permease subunit